MERERPPRADDTLHPVRRFRREPPGGLTPPPGAWDQPQGTSPPALSADVPPAGEGSRLHLALALALVLAVSVAWSAATLLGQRPAAPTPLIRTSAAFASQAPADAIGDLRMYSRTTGWAQRISDRAVLHTGLGVLRWTVASPPTAQAVIAVSYLGAETAQALTVPDDADGQTSVESWSTSDGGTTWSAGGGFVVLGFSPGLIGSLDFVDPRHGWFSELQDDPGITGTALYRTVDGGAGWTRVVVVGTAGPAGSERAGSAPTGCVQLTATFISATTGWLTGTCSTGPPPLYLSHDGGLTWADQPLTPLAGGLFGETSSPPRFTSSQDGTLVTQDDGAAPLSAGVFATTNGGRTWSRRYATAATPVGSDFVGAEDGWLAMASAGSGDPAAPDLYFTADGGRSWSILYAFPSIGYTGLNLDFLTPGTGWASTDPGQTAGLASYLLETDDGGRDWTALRPQLSLQSPPP